MQLHSSDKAEASSLFEGIKEKKYFVLRTKFVASHRWFNSSKDLVFFCKKKIILKGNGNTAGADTKVVEANLKHFSVYET